MTENPYEPPGTPSPVEERNRPSTGFVLALITAMLIGFGLAVLRTGRSTVTMVPAPGPTSGKSIDDSSESSDSAVQ